MGLKRWGAPFNQIVTSKGASVENRLLIEDVNQQVKRRYHSDKLRIDEFWRRGSMPDIRSEVTYFEDTPQATYARVSVQNMDGLPLWSMNESLSSPRTAFWPQGKLSPLRKASKHAWPRCGTLTMSAPKSAVTGPVYPSTRSQQWHPKHEEPSCRSSSVVCRS